MRQNKALEAELANKRRELESVRRAAFIASRKGDFLRSARLSAQAVTLSKSIIEAEGLISTDLF
ncbi:MAG: hypothetical protein SFY81_15845 [Verrucomicrobiota bacterium]|nr:hypothetical protein [Verrucomicrobiota bacterium]